jgi:hypothetical protein
VRVTEPYLFEISQVRHIGSTIMLDAERCIRDAELLPSWGTAGELGRGLVASSLGGLLSTILN